MSNYKCEKCNKKFTRKTAYASHLMRVSSCIKDTNINNECTYCSKLYSNKHNLKVHMNSCKEKSNIDTIIQSQIEELKKMFEKKFEEQQKKFEEQQKDNQELKKKVEELSHGSDHKEMSNNNININENSNNTNNTTNNITIYSMGKEDLSLISKEDIIKICTSGTYYPIVAAEILHCNDKYPAFQNVLISNLRATTGQVKVNDKWITRSQDDILNTMMNTDKKHISSLIKDLEVDKKLQVKLESTQDEIDTNQVKEHQKSKIKQRLYDASDMIKINKSKNDK
jgi:hypothetical protein